MRETVVVHSSLQIILIRVDHGDGVGEHEVAHEQEDEVAPKVLAHALAATGL